MTFYTSYFYQIRNFKPWQIPISTALSDPSWFHAGKGRCYKFFDKRNVLNGLRAEFLHPGKACEGLCHGRSCCSDTPESCQFLKAYSAQLQALDMKEVMTKLKNLESKLKKALHTEHELEIILIVHEAPTNNCSERKALQDLFNCTELQIT